MDNFKALPPETAKPAQWDGVYYGPAGRVLARTDTALLLWVPGHAAWNGTGRPWRYEPSGMIIHLVGGDRYQRLSTGGRLATKLKENAAAIDQFFGDGFSKLLDPAATIAFQ
jgi:hypothetical protein